MKPLLLTMTQSREEHIQQMVKNIYPTFDGIIAVLNQPSTDNTEQILKDNLGNGKIIKVQWTNNHAFLMNHLLYYGNIKEGQWCLYLDSPESCADKFIEELPKIITYCEQNNGAAVYWDNRPYLFKYHSYLEFFGAVHWGLLGINGHILTLPNKDDYIINRRKETPKYYGSLNGTKYYLCYSLGNDIDLVYGKFGEEIRNFHELLRRRFRSYCTNQLGLNLNNLTDMVNYMIKIKNKEVLPGSFFIEVVEMEFRLSELFQIEVLDMDLIKDIVPRRYRWSFVDYLKTGDGFINSDYKGIIIQYQEKFNIKEG